MQTRSVRLGERLSATFSLVDVEIVTSKAIKQ